MLRSCFLSGDIAIANIRAATEAYIDGGRDALRPRPDAAAAVGGAFLNTAIDALTLNDYKNWVAGGGYPFISILWARPQIGFASEMIIAMRRGRETAMLVANDGMFTFATEAPRQFCEGTFSIYLAPVIVRPQNIWSQPAFLLTGYMRGSGGVQVYNLSDATFVEAYKNGFSNSSNGAYDAYQSASVFALPLFPHETLDTYSRIDMTGYPNMNVVQHADALGPVPHYQMAEEVSRLLGLQHTGYMYGMYSYMLGKRAGPPTLLHRGYSLCFGPNRAVVETPGRTPWPGRPYPGMLQEVLGRANGSQQRIPKTLDEVARQISMTTGQPLNVI
jgi:hypothetical protein